MKEMVTSLSDKNLTNYLVKQLNNYFPDNNEVEFNAIFNSVKESLVRLELCFNKIHLPYYNKNGQPYFNHLHGDHYSMFLYLVSNTMYKNNLDENLCAKVFLLNKSFFGIDAFYAINLPIHFLFVHPIGTILGNANYGDYFVVYQGVTVGATTDGIYPSFAERTILYSNSSIIGDCTLCQDTIIAANSTLVNCNVDHNKTILGNYPTNKIITNKNSLINKYFLYEK